jgi:hypothetical protein
VMLLDASPCDPFRSESFLIPELPDNTRVEFRHIRTSTLSCDILQILFPLLLSFITDLKILLFFLYSFKMRIDNSF